jgi:hypothetical protein
MTRAPILCLAAIGCATTATPAAQTPAQAGQARPPLKIVEPDFGKENSKRSEALVVPFGVNQDGTELVLVAIDRAKQAGAAFVGDMQMIVTFKWSGTTVECKTRLVYDGDPALAEKPEPAPAKEAGAYTTSIEEYRPRKMTVTARENALMCEEGKVTRVVKRKPTIDERMDVGQSRAMSRVGGSTPLDEEVQTEGVDRCHKELVERTAERYDYELKLGFIPPDLTYLTKRYGERALRTTAPVCYTVDKPIEPLYRLTATAFYRGDTATKPTTRLPSDQIYEDMERPETVSAEAQLQRCKQLGGGPRCETEMRKPSDSGWNTNGGKNQWKEKDGPWRAPDER